MIAHSSVVQKYVVESAYFVQQYIIIIFLLFIMASIHLLGSHHHPTPRLYASYIGSTSDVIYSRYAICIIMLY